MSNIAVSIKLSGLLPFEKYDYAFEGMGGNWPCLITPLSGTIRPYGDSVNLEANVHFCTTKNSCPSGAPELLPYTTGLCDSSPNLFTSLRLSLKPETLPYTLYSDIKTVKCDNCFAQPVITPPQSVTLTKTQGNEYTMNTSIVGLQPNTTYNYTFTSLEANWPVRVSPASGVIKVGKDRTILTNMVMFCKDDTICPVGGDVLEYTINSNCLNEQNYYSILQLELVNADCNTESVLSNPIPVVCKNCLPSIGINLYPQNRKIVSEIENNSGFLIEPIISGLKPDHEYTYEFKGLDANWPVFINPVSGILQSPTTSTVLSAQIFFCANTGICSEGSKGVLNYSLDTISTTKVKRDQFVNLQLELQDVSCSETYTSNTLLVYCNDCLPTSNIRIISNRVT
jgi:hypothetical protein